MPDREEQVEIRRPAPRAPSLREQRDMTARRVHEEFERSGTLPSTLLRLLYDQETSLRWSEGRPVPREVVEKYLDEWAADLLSKDDQKKAS